LLVLNFPVPVELIARQAPPGTEPDLHEGRAYISIVGFRFQNTRLFGVPVPGHTRFTEINMRYNVRRFEKGELRRGVVFVKEIVPRRAVTATANWLYHENYITRPMRSEIRRTGEELDVDDAIEYGWQTGRRSRLSAGSGRPRWHRLAARLAEPPQLPHPGSVEEFIIEHYWGYARGRDGHTREYRVLHEPWRIARADGVVWECDPAGTYDTPWAEHLVAPPTSALVADGSHVRVFRGRRL
jgi:uncharacterized protein YqjF (DUF2071 family)